MAVDPESTGQSNANSTGVEKQAIVRCQEGEIDGLRILYELYSEKIFRTCLRILGDPAEAEDLVHEVFLRLYEQIGCFGYRSRFSTWLYRLAVNHTLNRLRATRRYREKLAHWGREVDLAEGFSSPELELAKRQDSDLVQQLLARLSPDHRIVLVLREIEELSYREISQVLGVPTGTVMSRLHRARQELKSHYQTRNDGESTVVQINVGGKEVES